jgi:geranylgeranylglycerol-phosphate geranylgeranyltransferase
MGRINHQTIIALVELTRPLNGLIIFVSVILAALLAGARQENLELVFLAALTAMLIGAGGYAINDYYDVHIDAINRPDRPLPRLAISLRAAYALWLVTTAAGLLLSLTLPWHASVLAALVAILLFWYSFRLKRMTLLRNISIASLTALVFVYGASLVGNIRQAAYPALFAFLTNFMREVSKDVEDLEGDQREGVFTIPSRYGVSRAHRIIVVLAALLILLSFLPYLTGLYNAAYLVCVSVIDVALGLFIIIFLKPQNIASFRAFSRLLKLVMVLGLLAMFLGSAHL